MDGKSGDSRFSRRGVGGVRVRDGVEARGCGVGEMRVWCSAHATHPEPSAGSRRFRTGGRQLRN